MEYLSGWNLRTLHFCCWNQCPHEIDDERKLVAVKCFDDTSWDKDLQRENLYPDGIRHNCSYLYDTAFTWPLILIYMFFKIMLSSPKTKVPFHKIMNGRVSVVYTMFLLGSERGWGGVKWKIMSILEGVGAIFWAFQRVDLTSLVIWAVKPSNPPIDHTGLNPNWYALYRRVFFFFLFLTSLPKGDGYHPY